jgi:hypothetical protein
MINLLEKYFDMNKKQCREALDIYKKFLDRTDKVSSFLKVAETSGMERSEIPDLSRAPSSLLEALENHLAHMEGKKIPSQSSISRAQTEQDLKSFSRDLIFNDSDDPQKILEEEAKALAQFNKNKDSSSPTTFTQATTITSASGNGFGGTDFFSPQPSSSSSNGQHTTVQQLLTDDLFSLATPPSQTSTNTFFNNNQNAFPAFQQPQQPFQTVLDTSVPRTNFFDDILQPTSMSTAKNNTTTTPFFNNNQNIPTTTKPLQSGDLNSSLNQLLENLDIKDRSKIGKDHQWTPGDGKNQQKIGIGGANMNSSSTTWPNQMPMGGAFGGMGVQQPTMWQQPPPQSSASTNPFAAPTGPSQMGFGGMGARPTGAGTNPFAGQPSFGNSPFGQPPKSNQQQVNDPFGNL